MCPGTETFSVRFTSTISVDAQSSSWAVNVCEPILAVPIPAGLSRGAGMQPLEPASYGYLFCGGGRPHGPPQNEVAQTTTCFALPCTGGYGALCDWAKTTQWHFSWLLHSCEWSVTRSHPENKKFQYFTEFQLAFLFHYNPNDLPLSCRER